MWGSTGKPASKAGSGMLATCIGATPTGMGQRVANAFKGAKPALMKCLEQAARWVKMNAAIAIIGAVTATAFTWTNAFKSLPLVWHARLFFNAVFPRKGYFEADKPGSVFRPIITPASVSWFESDFALEKSSSSYYSDLDIAVSDLLGTIRYEAIRGGLLDEGYEEDGIQTRVEGSSCTFKEALKPGMSFDMQSRVLAWDTEYIYIITHFVEKLRKGAARAPATPTLKAGHKKKGSGGSGSSSTGNLSRRSSCLAFASLPQVVYATAISKCRVKSGRMNISPTEFLGAAELVVPPLDHSDLGSMVSGVSPSSVVSSSSSASQMTSLPRKHKGETEEERKVRKKLEKKEKERRERKDREKKDRKEKEKKEKSSSGSHVSSSSKRASAADPMSPSGGKQHQPAGEAMMAWLAGIDGWTWDFVEEERIRGLKIADRVFGFGLDAAHDEFVNPK